MIKFQVNNPIVRGRSSLQEQNEGQKVTTMENPTASGGENHFPILKQPFFYNIFQSIFFHDQPNMSLSSDFKLNNNDVQTVLQYTSFARSIRYVEHSFATGKMVSHPFYSILANKAI